LTKIDVGTWYAEAAGLVKSDTDKSETITIPLFSSVVEYCIANDIWMNVEIKPVPGYEVQTGEVVARTLSEYFPASAVTSTTTCTSTASGLLPLFSSFSYEALKAASTVAPHIPRGYLITSLSAVPNWQERMVSLSGVSVHTDHKTLSPDQVVEIKCQGYGIMCYTVNAVERAEEITGWGVDSFCTDRLDLFTP
jgi:glycerophosphoryl diester phosphodiesterase